MLCLFAAGSVACTSAAAPRPTPHPIRIVSSTPGGSVFANVLEQAYGERFTDLAPDVLESPGILTTLEMLNNGDADVGYSTANVAYAAFSGQLPSRGDRFQRLRAIALLRRWAMHVVVGPQSTAGSMEDLRNVRVTSAGPGARLALTADWVLPAFGLDATKIDVAHTPTAHKAIEKLLDGRIGALVILGVPPVGIVQAALDGGARLLPVDGAPVGRLLREYPFYSAMMIPADAYNSPPVVTVGVDGVLMSRSDLDPDIVYRLTRALYESPEGAHVHPAFAQWIDAAVGAATPIPLHAGAARYYRERELR